MRYWLVLLVAFFVLRYVLPIVLRAVLGGFVRRQVHKMQDQQRAAAGGRGPFGHAPGGRPGPPPAPGEVRVDYVPPQKGVGGNAGPASQAGEYVDYEEV